MTKATLKNEAIKRDFYEQLQGARGFTNGSIHVFAEAINQWQIFSKDEDFLSFNKTKAAAFVNWLNTRKAKTKTGKLAIVTQSNYLRRVKKFFEWLSEQAGYKSKILKNDVYFLRLSKKDAQIARQGTTNKIPTLEEAKKIIDGIDAKNELDLRDRALICFALITGARISAITTLKMKSFNKHEKLIDQNPADGVKTKISKRIFSTFFPIDWDEPERYFMEWYESLESKGYQPDDPIFPSTLNYFGTQKNNYSKDSVSKNFWGNAGAARKIFEKRCLNAGVPYFHPHLFRHLAVSIVSKARLTEAEKKAVSLNLGHEDVATTFGSYGYGNMTTEEAISIVKGLKRSQDDFRGNFITDEERSVLEKIARRNS